MKTLTHSIIDEMMKRLTEIQLQFRVKQIQYNEALKADEKFSRIKELRTEMKTLEQSMRELEIEILTASQLKQI